MNVVIKVENLSKQYQLGVMSHRALYRDAQSWWARVRGKEDPNVPLNLSAPHQQRKNAGERFWALDDISFEVGQGEVLGIIGRNGAGKSTLLKILSRVTTPTKGVVKIKGRVASLLEVGTGFHPELTGRENVFLNGAILGMTKREIRSKFDEIVNFAELADFIDTPVKRYSSGMYVRLAFAVAAHLEPEILLVDEVLAVGDAGFQKKCIGKMDDMSVKSGRTVLFVSHNLSFIRSLCSRTIWLDNGKITASGNSADIINQYTLSFRGKEFNECSEIGNSHLRRGTGVVKFTCIDFINEKQEKVTAFEAGEKYLIHTTLKVFSPVDCLEFCFVIRSPVSEDVIFTSPYTHLKNGRVHPGEELAFELALFAPYLTTGEYPLLLWLGKSGPNVCYDLLDGIFHLHIISHKKAEELGYNPDNPGGYLNVKTLLTVKNITFAKTGISQS